MVELNQEEMGAVVRRLRRAQGQIGGIVQMIEQGRNCEDIVTQLAAANHALDRAGFAILTTSLKQCLTEPHGTDSVNTQTDTQTLEKLFLSLS